MHLPDLCGYTLERAMKILKEHSLNDYIIRVTGKPGSENTYSQNSRVIALAMLDTGQIELLVCNP